MNWLSEMNPEILFFYTFWAFLIITAIPPAIFEFLGGGQQSKKFDLVGKKKYFFASPLPNIMNL